MRLRMLPLRITAATTAATLALPLLLLLLFPRRSAKGIDRLLPVAALMQSFSVRPGEPPPPAWQQRLSPDQASTLWGQQRRRWWQFWTSHGDAGAYLVFSAPAGAALPPDAWRVDDLVVMAPGPLARQWLEKQLQVPQRAPRGLIQRCSQSLVQQDSVYWNRAALAPLLGPLAPLAASLQQGCFALRQDGSSLLWQGEADATASALSPPAQQPPPPQRVTPSDGVLLQWQGPRLALLLSGILNATALRQVLIDRYGLTSELIEQLQGAPFALRLGAVKEGPYRASLALALELPGDPSRWQRWLSVLQTVLLDQALLQRSSGSGAKLWILNGEVRGGWRWLSASRLLLFLGPEPTPSPFEFPTRDAPWMLLLKPAALAAAGWLPPAAPLVVKRAQTLVLTGRGAGVSGRLDLR